MTRKSMELVDGGQKNQYNVQETKWGGEGVGDGEWMPTFLLRG